MSKIEATVVADSINPQKDRLTSVLVTMPRIILSEMNTHRMLSKNTSSSRAIPFNKMVEAIENDPFIPIAWQKEHTGMQGYEYITDEKNLRRIKEDWLEARDSAIYSATQLNTGFNLKNEEGEYVMTKPELRVDRVTKQLCNRLLEPFMWTTMLITGSREGWDNFFNLRCPVYYYAGNDKSYKSKKELLPILLNDFGKSPADSFWYNINKGQAEIHMMALAESIYDAVNESTPKQLQAGEWHIPMISDSESLKLSTNDQIKLSVGRAANTSYTVVGDGKELTLEHAIKIHDKCVELVHSSVFEHCARAMSDDEYTSFIKGQYPIFKDEWGIGNHETYLFKTKKMYEGNEENFEPITKDLIPIHGWCNNLKGFIPYRYFINNKIEL